MRHFGVDRVGLRPPGMTAGRATYIVIAPAT